MSKYKANPAEVNAIILESLKEVVAKNPKLNTREYCLFSVADTGKGQFVVIIVDRNTSIMMPINLDYNQPMVITKQVIFGIVKKILYKYNPTISKSPKQVYDWDKKPLTAKGRQSKYETTLTLNEGKCKIHLFTWGKIIITG